MTAKMRANRTLAFKLSISQERKAYRLSVTACLIEIMGVDERTAQKTVAEWWKRLQKTAAYRSGLFMHAEPIHSAHELQNDGSSPAPAHNKTHGTLYAEILKRNFGTRATNTCVI